jgi:hypothetical protein
MTPKEERSADTQLILEEQSLVVRRWPITTESKLPSLNNSRKANHDNKT